MVQRMYDLQIAQLWAHQPAKKLHSFMAWQLALQRACREDGASLDSARY